MDQAERLRSLMNSRSSRARVIAVASGKGGVGKTNLSVNLAVAMTRMGRRVVLADLPHGNRVGVVRHPVGIDRLIAYPLEQVYESLVGEVAEAEGRDRA